MKELHNHIFSNTTCISKETMLRCINKQLSKNELHDVEKHMLDCELCSDAYEGMAFSKNSSFLFAIDNRIDQRVRMGNSRVPIMKSIMMAASVLLIVFGAYFTYDYFNTTLVDGALAVNQPEKVKEENLLEEVMMDNEESNSFQEKPLLEFSKKNGVAQNNRAQRETSVANIKVLREMEKTVEVYESEVEEIAPMAVVDDWVVAEEIITPLEEEVSSNIEVEKIMELKDELATAGNDNKNKNNFNSTTNPVSKNSDDFGGFAGNGAVLNKESNKRKVGALSGKKNRKRNVKFSEQSSALQYDVGVTVKPETLSDKKESKLLVIHTYKVVDYMTEYQKEYDLKNTNKIATKSVSAGFENKADEDKAKKEEDELFVAISYKETLTKAMSFYKNKKYNEAINQFDIILKEHPNEVNGLFYEGLSNYHLGRFEKAEGKLNQVLTNKKTDFNEEASWYKALILIEIKQTEKAKTLLKTISKQNGFYKTKAIEKLKDL